MPDWGFTSLSDIPVEEVADGFSRRNLVGEKQMISWGKMRKGSVANRHSHPHEQVFIILEGRVDFELGAERRICPAGSVVLVQPNLEHSMLCLEDTEFMTVLAPPRADLQTGAPAPHHFESSR